MQKPKAKPVSARPQVQEHSERRYRVIVIQDGEVVYADSPVLTLGEAIVCQSNFDSTWGARGHRAAIVARNTETAFNPNRLRIFAATE